MGLFLRLLGMSIVLRVQVAMASANLGVLSNFVTDHEPTLFSAGSVALFFSLIF